MKKITLLLLVAGISFYGFGQDESKDYKKAGLKKIEGISGLSQLSQLSSLSELSKLSELSSLSELSRLSELSALSELSVSASLVELDGFQLEMDKELVEMFKDFENYSDMREYAQIDNYVDLENIGKVIEQALKRVGEEKEE